MTATLPSGTKLFGRYHEIGLMLCGFVLTTILGGVLTFWYQQQAWERDDKAKRKQEQLVRASTTLDDLSRLIDRRLYRLRNVQGALEVKATDAEVSAMRASYREVVSEWNESLNRNLVQTEMSFGPDARHLFESSIVEGFRSLHRELIDTVAEPTPDRIQKLKVGADKMSPKVYAFNLDLLRRLQQGDIGSFSSSRPRSESTQAPVQALEVGRLEQFQNTGPFERQGLPAPNAPGPFDGSRPSKGTGPFETRP